MLPKYREQALRGELRKLTREELVEFVVENAKTISGMKDLLDGARQLLGAFQEGRLTANFDETTRSHKFEFDITDALVNANPDLTQIATVIATQVHCYIKSRQKQKAVDLNRCDCQCHTEKGGVCGFDACCQGSCEGCKQGFRNLEFHRKNCPDWLEWDSKQKRSKPPTDPPPLTGIEVNESSP